MFPLRLLVACASSLTLVFATSASRAEDLADKPLETLLDAEVVSAARFAQQISEAASAVSVLTSEDIRILGLRTLGEVLDQMRGLHVSHSTEYVFLGGRGIGGPQSWAGRVQLLIDGIPAVDNLYDQVYLGHDAVIDVALIDRIEYAPGSGSAMYGNSAFLGVINVVTKRGRHIDGLQASTARSDWGDQNLRVTAGQRVSGGAEWLLSFTTHRNSGLPSDEIGNLYRFSSGDDQRLFLKAQYEGYSLEAWTAERRMVTVHDSAYRLAHTDRNELISLGHDGRPAPGWHTSVRLQTGRYAYRADGFDTSVPTEFVQENNGTWWSLEGQLGYDGFTDHRVVFGLRARRDPLLRWSATSDGVLYGQDDNRRSMGLSVEDEYTLSTACRIISGVRVDHPGYARTAWSPLAALVCEPAGGWTVKLSEGRATRFASVDESGYDKSRGDTADERVTTQELVSEYRREGLRLLGTLYRFQVGGITRAPGAAGTGPLPSTDGHGVELEAEWQWHGWRLRGSQAWQHASADTGVPLSYAPRSVTKLQASAPLVGEALRLSLTARRVGGFLDVGDPPQPVPSRTLVDLTLVSQQWLPGLDVRAGWNNLLRQREQAMDPFFGYEPPTGRRQRTAWIEFTGTFR